MLPESKDGFPKLLYLDHLHWINLSRAKYQHPLGGEFQEALLAVRTAVNNRKLIVPLSAIHLMEIMHDPDPPRRERLARFMIELSRNLTILPSWAVTPWEIRNALWLLFGRNPPIRVRECIVRQGLGNAIGRQLRCAGPTPEVEAATLRDANSPERTLTVLMSVGDEQELTRQYLDSETAFVDHLDQIRRRAVGSLILDEQRGVEMASFFYENGRRVDDSLQELGISVQTLMGRIPSKDEIINFVSGVRTSYTSLELTLASGRNLGRPIAPNDIRDILWLSIAVPYSNLVVSEHHWGHMIRSCRLDQRYGTVLSTDARELPAQLSKLGCL